jgi:hypothetical protein
MKIDTIFVGHLYAFHYDKEVDNELDRLLEIWTNVRYLKVFAQKNNITDIKTFVENRLIDADEMQDKIDEIRINNEILDRFFRPLHNFETAYGILSLQKGKKPHNHLRLYAIRIDTNCYVITGGAIKMSLDMKDHPLTQKEVEKLNWAKSYLQDNQVFDNDSFFEFLTESND